MSADDSRRIRKNSAWMMADTVARQAISLVLIVWATRVLGPVGFGRLSFALSLYALFGIVTTLGLNRIAVREFASGSDSHSTNRLLVTALAMRLVASVVVAVLAIACCGIIAPDNVVLVAILVLGYFFTAFDVVDLFFQSQLRSPALVWRRFLAFMASSAIKAALLLSGAGVGLITFACLLDWAFMAAALVWLYHVKVGIFALPRPDWKLASSLFAECRIEIIAGFSGLAFMKIDQLMLEVMRGPTEVAVMAVSTRLTEAWYFVPVVVVSSAFPVIVKLSRHDPDGALVRLKSLYRWLVGLGLIAGIATQLFARIVIDTLYGPRYEAAASVLAIQIWCGVFMSLGITSGAWLMTHRLGTLNLRRNVLGMAINIGLNLLLIPQYGAIGSAWATLAAFACAYLVYDFVDPAMRSIGREKLRALTLR